MTAEQHFCSEGKTRSGEDYKQTLIARTTSIRRATGNGIGTITIPIVLPLSARDIGIVGNNNDTSWASFVIRRYRYSSGQ